MRVARQSLPGLQQLAELIETIGPGMLATRDAAGRLSSRPMSPLEFDRDGTLWFFARRSSPADYSCDINLTFVQPDEALYLSLTGRATPVDDRRRVDSLWSSTARIWFPLGADDPELLLLRVHIESGCCWDPFLGRMRQLFPDPAAQDGWFDSSLKSSS